MGGSQSYPGLTEDILEDYTTLTYLNKGEILYAFIEDGFRLYNITLRPIGAKNQWEMWKKTLMKKFNSINPEKLERDYNHRFSKDEIIDKFHVLKNNPFQDRIFKVFSSKDDDCFSFEDMLDLSSAMSSECPVDVKATWAFRIFDLDNDNQISKRDICEILDRLTGINNKSQYCLDDESKLKIAQTILQEMKFESNDSVGLGEFKIIMARLPEFTNSFYFRL